VKSDLTIPKGDKLKLRVIYKRRPRNFGELSVHQSLKFRDHYLGISRRYRKYTFGQDQIHKIKLLLMSDSNFRYQQTEIIDIFLYLGAMFLNM